MYQQKRERQADVLSKTPKLSTFFKSIDCPPDDEDQNIPWLPLAAFFKP